VLQDHPALDASNAIVTQDLPLAKALLITLKVIKLTGIH
jgi:hypothetical protein